MKPSSRALTTMMFARTICCALKIASGAKLVTSSLEPMSSSSATSAKPMRPATALM